jgi:uncharacterized protein YggT (Ycf19 family)
MTIEVEGSNLASQLILAANIKGYVDVFKPQGPIFNPPPMYFYTDPVEGFFNFFIVESSVTSPVYLPNWLSEIIQFLGNQQINIIALREVQEWLYDFLKIFQTLCQMRATLWWWLMFNPYQQPFNTLRVLTEWYLTMFTGVFPVIIGIDIGPTVGLALLGNGLDLLGRLVFTMPYLPREGELFTVADLDLLDNSSLSEMLTKFGHDVRIYRYFPSLWSKYSIPDSLRESWYTKKPEIIEYLIKNYYNLGIDFLPNRILKDHYEKINHESLALGLSNVEHNSMILANLFPTNLLHLNL